jgi:hypothetical protein
MWTTSGFAKAKSSHPEGMLERLHAESETVPLIRDDSG